MEQLQANPPSGSQTLLGAGCKAWWTAAVGLNGPPRTPQLLREPVANGPTYSRRNFGPPSSRSRTTWALMVSCAQVRGLSWSDTSRGTGVDYPEGVRVQPQYAVEHGDVANSTDCSSPQQ